MNRVELLDTLSAVRPALASSDMVPEFTHFWFYGPTVVACNDRIAISKPCKTEFTGALPGQHLLRLLSASGAKEVHFSSDKQDVRMKLGGADCKLAVLPLKDLFQMPKPQPNKSLSLDYQELKQSLNHCMMAITDDASGYAGVAFVPKSHQISLFSSNGKALVHAPVKCKNSDVKAILSEVFCRQLLNFISEENPSLELHENYALFSSKNTMLWGRLLNPDAPSDFDGTLDRIIPTNLNKASFKIPAAFRYALDRAIVILDHTSSDGYANFDLQNGELVITSKSSLGTVVDKIKGIAQDDIKTRFNPVLLKVGCEQFDHVLLTKGYAIVTDKRNIYIVVESYQ